MKTLHLLPILGAALLGGCVYEEEYYGYERPHRVYRGGYVDRDYYYDDRPRYYYEDRPRYYHDDRPRYYGGPVITIEGRHRDEWRDRDDDRKKKDNDHGDKKKKKDSDDSHQSYSRFSNLPPVSATRQGPLPRYQIQSQPQPQDSDKKKKKHKDDHD
jgi:hypothetical protein